MPNPLEDEKSILEQVAGLRFSFEGCRDNWILRTNPGFSYGSRGRTQDFCVNSQNQARISIVYLEAYGGPSGATALGSAYLSRSLSL